MKSTDGITGWILAITSSVIIVYLLIFNPYLYNDPPTAADVEVVDSIPHRDKVRWPDQTEDKLPGDSIVEKPKFNPHKREFTLDDGTPCVWFSVPSYSSRKADASGVSCDWGYQDDHELIF